MCGIVLSIGKSTYTHNLENWFRDAMIASQVRGVHSTGLFIKKWGKGIEFEKAAEPASIFMQRGTVRSMLTRMDAHQLTVGHVRHATQGSVTDANAHPFVVEGEQGEVVGVHNGSLTGWKPTTGQSEHEVDSEWALKLIADKGKDAFKEIKGAYCFVWTNIKFPDHVFMARNKERPFHFAIIDRGDALVGCSESGMLDWLIDKHELTPVDNTVYSLEAGVLYAVNIRTLEITTEKLELPAAATTTSSNGYWYNGKFYSTTQMTNYSRDEDKILDGVTELLESVSKQEAAQPEDRVPFLPGPMIGEGSGAMSNPAWDLVYSVMKMKVVDDSLASPEEIKQAKRFKYYGRVALIDPVLWDDSMEAMMCEATFADEFDEEKSVKKDCLMYGITPEQADAMYFSTNQVGAGCIIGYASPGKKEECLIAIPLTKEQENFLQTWDMNSEIAAA